MLIAVHPTSDRNRNSDRGFLQVFGVRCKNEVDTKKTITKHKVLVFHHHSLKPVYNPFHNRNSFGHGRHRRMGSFPKSRIAHSRTCRAFPTTFTMHSHTGMERNYHESNDSFHVRPITPKTRTVRPLPIGG